MRPVVPSDKSSMIPLRKIIPIETFAPKVGHDDRITLWGSCFADELSKYLEGELYPICKSPFGIMYNPLSMAEGMRRLIGGIPPEEDELIQSNGLWTSSMHHGSFSGADKASTLERMRETFKEARQALPDTRLFVFTFGTSYVYEEEANGEIVNNCHKRPSSDFTRRRASVEEIVDPWLSIIERLSSISPKASFLFSVSPIPHYRDGVHENSLSKAVLHLAVDEIIQNAYPRGRAYYFPSFEIMRDELRDYRFYAEDFAHPAPLAVSYIMDRFSNHYLSPWEGQDEWHKLRALIGHRPLSADPVKLRAHYSSILDKLNTLMDRRPHPLLSEYKNAFARLYDSL